MRRELRGLPCCLEADRLLLLLLLAGELECAVLDKLPSSASAAAAARLTDLLADCAVAADAMRTVGDGQQLERRALPILDGIEPHGELEIGVPEGFAYYALHPLDFAGVVNGLDLSLTSAYVIGIRSIGTTVSAVVKASLRQCGISAERTTVRPAGHPYDRVCDFDTGQRGEIAVAVASQAAFLICDEGPGRSGSSLLSVGEALEREGAARERIVLLCSHEPDVNALCAPDAAKRWGRYRSAATGMTRRLPADAGEFLGGGKWRGRMMSSREHWPTVWPQMEPLQYLSSGEGRLFRFEGYGPYGARAHDRNLALSDAGFGARYGGHEAGFGEHALEATRRASCRELSAELVTRMARYCDWRARTFPATGADAEELAKMTRVNLEREFGWRLDELTLPLERPAICDAHMHPYEWSRSMRGDWLKLNAATHGDGHFLPGPCDVAWDLAGIVVEWEFSEASREFLLVQYRRASGDDIARRIGSYELAYAVFRMAWSKMAADSVCQTDENARLLRDYRRYRRLAKASAQRFGWVGPKASAMMR